MVNSQLNDAAAAVLSSLPRLLSKGWLTATQQAGVGIESAPRFPSTGF